VREYLDRTGLSWETVEGLHRKGYHIRDVIEEDRVSDLPDTGSRAPKHPATRRIYAALVSSFSSGTIVLANTSISLLMPSGRGCCLATTLTSYFAV
jgi:hypothetical protein